MVRQDDRDAEIAGCPQLVDAKARDHTVNVQYVGALAL
jgi:hypothetical protein